MKDKFIVFLIVILFLLIGAGVYSNILEQKSVDRSKIPSKVEQSTQFQRWMTNLRNNDVNIGADDFRLKEEVEIYNTKWMTVSSIDDPDKKEEYDKIVAAHRNLEKVVFSPSDRIFVDFRNIPRDNYNSNEAHFYGLKEDKIIDARIVDCSIRANCYFDRAYFLDNDVFVITEISRNIDKKDESAPPCTPSEECEYTYKLHLIDFINNSRLIYESKPFEVVLDELIPQL